MNSLAAGYLGAPRHHRGGDGEDVSLHGSARPAREPPGLGCLCQESRWAVSTQADPILKVLVSVHGSVCVGLIGSVHVCLGLCVGK